MTAACARLREDPAVVDLPARLSLFGLTRLPAGRLAVLRALAAHRDVHLFLLHPSPALWERIRGHGPVVRRAADPTTALPANPLLASWGHDSRELQLVIGDDDALDHRHPVEHDTGTLLARIQADVREDRAPLAADDPARPLLAPGDRSLEIHACHGRARQVEVLRDAILHLLADDPTLEPRDVIVMCPDIETFAPLIHATFGAGDVTGEELPGALPDLRVRLADRSIRQTNPVLGVVARLLELVDERLTASQVLDLADREPVRRRFRFDDDDLARAEEWVRASGVRWGLDGPHRKPFKLDGLPSGTWRAGLDRLLLGVTMTEDEQRLFAGVLPLDDVESGAIELAGRVAELLDRLHAAVDALTDPKPVDDWAAALAAAADALTETTPHDAWQRAELQRLLDDVVTEAAGHATPLALQEVRALLADRLRGRPTRTNFRTGHLTVCTLVPMRSVPHRVVCLLGLDDGSFPRKSPRDGDDLMLGDPHVGERDARTEDRQLLLDALMAAGERLIVTYTGNDERTNLPRPPAVPVGELLEVVDRTVAAEQGRPRDRVVVRHPLQPFDQRNFAPGELVPDRVWSFDRVTLAGARALDAERTQPGPFLTGPAAAARGPGRRAGRPRPVRRAPRPRLPAAAARDPRRELRRRDRGRAAGRARRARPLGRRDSAAGGAAGRRRATHRGARRDRARHAAAGPARQAGDRQGPPDGRSDRRAGARGRADLARRQGRPARRAHAQRDGAGRRRRHAAHRHVLARERPPPADGVGAAARDHRRAPGPRLSIAHGRPGPGPGREHRRGPDRPARRRYCARPPDRAGRPLRPRHARAGAAVLPDLRRLCGRGPQRRRPGGRPRAPSGRARTRAPARPRTPTTSSSSARSTSTTCSSRGPGRTSRDRGGIPTSRAASAAGPAACGTGCSRASR